MAERNESFTQIDSRASINNGYSRYSSPSNWKLCPFSLLRNAPTPSPPSVVHLSICLFVYLLPDRKFVEFPISKRCLPCRAFANKRRIAHTHTHTTNMNDGYANKRIAHHKYLYVFGKSAPKLHQLHCVECDMIAVDAAARRSTCGLRCTPLPDAILVQILYAISSKSNTIPSLGRFGEAISLPRCLCVQRLPFTCSGVDW